jgi:hypothetical protein
VLKLKNCILINRVYVYNAFVFGLWCLTSLSTIFVISRRSILLVEVLGVPGENYWLAASQWQTLSHTVVSSTSRLCWGSHNPNTNALYTYTLFIRIQFYSIWLILNLEQTIPPIARLRNEWRVHKATSQKQYKSRTEVN